MSLATRCFACGTVFRVVQDQLKVSEGWVRCGRCNEVFNALDSLFDLERDTPPVWQNPIEVAAAEAAAAAAEPPSAPEITEEALVDRIDEQLSTSSRSHTTPATRVDERDRLEFPDAQFDPEFSIDMLSEQHADATTLPQSSLPSVPPPVVTEATPDFIRHAQRRAHWQSPAARAVLSIAALLLLSGLALQAGHHFRDVVAARWPATKPALQAWCDLLACTVQSPRRIEDVAVESTALTKGANADTFKLSIALRNRGNMALGMPSIDLTLTDALGQLVARKVLAPSDFQAGAATIPPTSEVPLQVLLTAGSAKVTGYTVEVFYP